MKQTDDMYNTEDGNIWKVFLFAIVYPLGLILLAGFAEWLSRELFTI